MSPLTTTSVTILRREGCAVVIRHLADGLPTVAHWGADLGNLTQTDVDELVRATSRQTPPGTLDSAWVPSILPTERDGWLGRPGLQVSRSGIELLPHWECVAVESSDHTLTLSAIDATNALALQSTVSMQKGGAVTVEHALTNTGHTPLAVDWLEATLPVPRSADHLTTFTGRWTREKHPNSMPWPRGATQRQTRRGRDGHDSPWLLAVSAGEVRNRSGELWATHVGWSGDTTWRSDRLTDLTCTIGSGELLRPGEVELEPGETYRAPRTWFVWSDEGWDGLTHRFHSALRARGEHPRSPRPFVLNTWEAVYFEHDPARLNELATRAAAVGVERFVLDDGWFLGRRDDSAGLGDWQVDRDVWPKGLKPLANHVHGLGMQFGLWFEPEMVNPRSRLAAEHPDWLLTASETGPSGVSWRSQDVLDLALPEAYTYVFSSMSSLIDELGIDFIKWDHNRDLTNARHHGRPGTHLQTLSAYRLISALKDRHPGLEIESCSSGGSRTDLGVLMHTDRVWASDSNDAIERQDIQRWTQLLLPPELVGGHVGPPRAHSSGRTLDFSFRAATSLMGSAGLEWNILDCTPEELEQVAAFSALYRELRGLIHSGRLVHPEVVDPALRAVGVVAQDQGEALFTVAAVATLEEAVPERLTLPALDPDARYEVLCRDELGLGAHGWITPPWLGAPVELSGRVLGEVGLQLPVLWPGHALIIHAVKVPPHAASETA